MTDNETKIYNEIVEFFEETEEYLTKQNILDYTRGYLDGLRNNNIVTDESTIKIERQVFQILLRGHEDEQLQIY